MGRCRTIPSGLQVDMAEQGKKPENDVKDDHVAEYAIC